VRVLRLVNVVNVQLEKGNHALDNVPVSGVLLVLLVPFQQYLVQLLVEFLDLLDVAKQQFLLGLCQDLQLLDRLLYALNVTC
jgi:hypothetical protein